MVSTRSTSGFAAPSRIARPASALFPSSRTTSGLVTASPRSASMASACTMPLATASQAVMPPKTLTKTLRTDGSDSTISSPFAITSAEVMANGLEIVLSDPSVRSVFVNVFGGITACDAVANGIVHALAMLAERGEAVTKPLVVRLDGNNAEAGRAILDGAANPLVERVDTMDGAARRAAQLATVGA